MVEDDCPIFLLCALVHIFNKCRFGICPVIRKPIGKYIDYKKSHQCKDGWRPAKWLWAWHWLRVIKPIKGGFRVQNVGSRYDGIMASWRKNIYFAPASGRRCGLKLPFKFSNQAVWVCHMQNQVSFCLSLIMRREFLNDKYSIYSTNTL